MLQKYCYLPTKLVKILFSLEIVQKKTKSKANSAAISGFLSNKYYKRIISLLESAENAYQLRPDQWSLMLRRVFVLVVARCVCDVFLIFAKRSKFQAKCLYKEKLFVPDRPGFFPGPQVRGNRTAVRVIFRNRSLFSKLFAKSYRRRSRNSN